MDTIRTTGTCLCTHVDRPQVASMVDAVTARGQVFLMSKCTFQEVPLNLSAEVLFHCDRAVSGFISCHETSSSA